MRTPVVEDEPKTAAYLRKGLEEAGFVVDVASQGDDGLHLVRRVEAVALEPPRHPTQEVRPSKRHRPQQAGTRRGEGISADSASAGPGPLKGRSPDRPDA
jgi:CheY-like chemotaxis protein